MIKLHPIDNRWHDGKEMMSAVTAVFSNLKVFFGTINNCIFLHIGDALGKLNDVPLDGNRKRLIKKVWEEWKDYESGLKYGDAHFFDLRTLPQVTRAKFEEGMTNEDYFDFWTAQGGKPYKTSLPMVSCLSNKFKLVIEKRGVKMPEKKAPLMAVNSMLCTQIDAFSDCVDKAHNVLGIRKCDLNAALSPFSLRRVRDAWWHLMRETIPETKTIVPDELEQSNIDMSLRQLTEMMYSVDFLFSGLMDATEKYDDLFISKRVINKELKDIAEVRDYFNSL